MGWEFYKNILMDVEGTGSRGRYFPNKSPRIKGKEGAEKPQDPSPKNFSIPQLWAVGKKEKILQEIWA